MLRLLMVKVFRLPVRNKKPTSVPAASCRLSVLVPAKSASEFLAGHTARLHQELTKLLGSSFEIILIPNPVPPQIEATSAVELLNLGAAFETQRQFAQIKVVPHYRPRGKFAALKAGLQAAQGEYILFTDADLPYHLDFIGRALKELGAGYDLVVANRRHQQSLTLIRSHLLARNLARELFGNAFNRFLRILLPKVRLKDTQAGAKAMTRDFALNAFSKITNNSFYGDIELILVARQNHYRILDIPVTLELMSNPSSVNFWKDTWLSFLWIMRIWIQNLSRYYSLKLKPVAEVQESFNSNDLPPSVKAGASLKTAQ